MYYTPDISEFHVGFEYEKNDGGDWYRTESDLYDLPSVKTCMNKYQLTDRIRVKYLDSNDIESLGFRFNGGVSEMNFDHLKKGYISLTYCKETNKLNITDDSKGEIWEYCLFIGVIKNKSELKKVLTQIGI